MRKLSLGIVMMGLLGLSLSGCGESPGCRALTGATIGAAGGAIVGALAGNRRGGRWCRRRGRGRPHLAQ